ncbi:hypothetical protein O3M35_011208 [Rhynocoris fuscipes]|uniref:C2H2-type domain-containing protein n=1 Tax=Rhynocoris fuscipes TaxID=488301 RepID=A0AAW1CVD9_9HEMI
MFIDAIVAEITYNCPRCARIYRSKRPLNRHLKYECGIDPQFFCPYCPFKTKRKTSLKTHIDLSVFYRRHQCDACGKSYKNKCHLNSHKRHECGVEPKFFCPHCPYKTKRETALKTHQLLKLSDVDFNQETLLVSE